MTSKTCEICNMTLVDDYSLYGHLQGKKHLRNVELANKKKHLEDCSIFVSPLPSGSSPNWIIKFFSQFGEIENHKFGLKHVVIEFKEKEPVDFLLNNAIFANSWRFTILPRKFSDNDIQDPNLSNKKKAKEEKTEPPFLDTMKAALEKLPTFDQQLEKLMSIAQPDEKQLSSTIEKICSCLQRILRASFRQGEVTPFGSSVSGLALLCSDLDIFFDVNVPIGEDDNIQLSPGTQKAYWTPKKIFKEVKGFLFRNSFIFTKIVPIPLARTPVIKFNYMPTNTDCDISFKQGLGVYNSQLIKFCLTLDPRIKPLIVILKCWSKKLDFSGSGKITNYPLVLLIFFYLQQSEIRLVPTIKELQDCESIIYKGWKVNFNENFPKTTSNCNKTIPELLQGFFKFYSNFGFTEKIIRPYDGTAPNRLDYKLAFSQNKDCTYESPNLSSTACLQDPIQLDHNIISGWCPKLLSTFMSACTEATEILNNANEDTGTLLPMLFSQVLKEKARKQKKYTFSIRPGAFLTYGLPDDYETRTDIVNKEEFINEHWFTMIHKLLMKIFVKVFKFEIENDNVTNEIKQIKLEEQSDVHSKNHKKIVLTFTGKYCVFQHRKGIKPENGNLLGYLDKEALISDMIVKDLASKNEERPMKFSLTLEKKTGPAPCIFGTIVDQLLTDKKFVDTAHTMKFQIPSLVEKELKYITRLKKELLTSVQSNEKKKNKKKMN